MPGRSRVRWPTHEPFLRVDFELQVAFVRKALDGSHDPGPPSHVVVAEHDSAGAEHTPKEHEIEGQLFLLVRGVYVDHVGCHTQPVEQPIIVSGDIETRAPQQSSYAAEPIMLKVRAKAQDNALVQPAPRLITATMESR